MKNPPKEPFDLEFRIIKSDDSVRNVHQRVEFIFDKNGIPIYAYGTIQDVTENKKLLKEVEYKQKEVNTIQKIFQVLVHESSDVFEIIAPDGTIKYISEAVEKVTGHKPEERIGKKVFDFYKGVELRKLKVMVESVLYDSEKKVKREVILRNKSGKDICLEVEMQNLLHEPVIEGIVVNFRDITSRIDMQKTMDYMSTHDELTGLPNQVYFKKQLNYQFQLAKDTKTEFGLIMLYFTELNYINYSLGYEIGQKLFIEISKRLKMFLGKDTFLCRYFEDHISIITHELRTYGKYEKFVEELIALFSLPYMVEKYELDISINIGICIYTGTEQNMDSLINHSLIALHRSRKEGKNKCKFYSSNLDIQNYKEYQLKKDLRSAPKKGQLRIYYQPVVNIKTNEILSAEALIRWKHPDWGLVSPDEFISLAEETGLIIDIGNWVLREVCSNYKKWLNEGFPQIKVSVNFSSIQFLQNEFVENIINTINEFELDPHFLIMEITESAIMENTNKAISDIRRLKSAGIQVALDDFGTGFSSLAYLSAFNIDILKLDGYFIKRVNIDNTATAILKNIINLTTDLKIISVVEGIETWEQLSYLKDLNCKAGQGFIYCKPMPLGDFEIVLAKRICEPIVVNYTAAANREDRRKLFRVEFPKILEADMTVLEVKGKRITVGNSKVLIKNIGLGGLCFISNIKLHVERDLILQFTTKLFEKEIKICGCPVWTKKADENLFEYGIEFTFDENERILLTQLLNQAQLK